MHYTLTRSSRRTLSISLGSDGEVLVRAPLRYSIEKIELFLHAKSSWIEKQKAKWKERQIQIAENIGYYSLFGERFVRGELSDAHIIKLSKESLRKYIQERLPQLIEGKTFRRSIANIRINSARTRWGSCSSKGNLSFSYRLAAFPRETIDAVIIHELAHLNHADHSKKFWDLVYTWMPDYESQVKTLKKSLPNEGGEIG